MDARGARDARARSRLASLGPLPAGSVEPLRRRITRAAALGRRLFFDARLSGNGKVSCATCHLPEQDFQDGKPLATGVGTTARRTMPIAGTAHSPWLFWDGRADSQWAQALGPLESAVEHGGSRTQYAQSIASAVPRASTRRVFGALPDLTGCRARPGPCPTPRGARRGSESPRCGGRTISRVYANIGKAIAAYERRIGPAPSRFDRYVDAELAGRRHTAESSALTRDEEAGLRLFIGKASCVNCHNGPLLTDDHFHNTGVPAADRCAAARQRSRGRRAAGCSRVSSTARAATATRSRRTARSCASR